MKRALLALACLSFLIPAASSAQQKKGHVTAAPCPHSCKTRGIAKSVCRDWREGNACYVEDLTRPPGYTNNMPSAPPAPPPVTRYPVDRPVFPRGECDPRRAYRIAVPRVEIYSVKKTGNFFGDDYRVRGAIEGVCIEEAGYFEKGRRKQSIPTVKTEQFRRFEFEVKVRADEYPDIRAYNVRGERDIYELDRRGLNDRDRYDDRDRYRDGSRGVWYRRGN